MIAGKAFRRLGAVPGKAGAGSAPGLAALLLLLLAGTALAGTFGQVIPIRGHIADIALDEARGRLYAANFTANRVEVVRTATRTLEGPIPVSAQPSSVSLSPNGRYLLVTHFGNRSGSTFLNSGYTIVNLESNTQHTFASASTPLAASFGINGLALVVTTSHFLLLDPTNGTGQAIQTVQGMAEQLSVELPKYPLEINQASMTSSADGTHIFGIASLQVNSDTGSSDMSVVFRYDVVRRILRGLSLTASPPLGPRVVSSSADGAFYMAGWALLNQRDALLAQFPNASGQYDIGTHVFDPKRGLIYAQYRAQTAGSSPIGPGSPGSDPVLQVLDDDNLAVRERLRLAENLSGKSILSKDGAAMWSASVSGVTYLPVGGIAGHPRVKASKESLLFEAPLNRQDVQTQEIDIVDPGGGNTPFVLNPLGTGVTFDPPAGHTPARVRVTVDPTAFLSQRGTSTVDVEILSGAAVNLPPTFRVLINTRGPDQRGRLVHVPGKLVDVLPDPVRDRFYVLRQDTNQVLVFDGGSYQQVAALRTGNTPTSMAITTDRRFLLVGNDNSAIANVFSLDTLQPDTFVTFPLGHYPRSIAASKRAILAACRVAGPVHTIDRIDFAARRATPYPNLGIFQNDISVNTSLAATPSGEYVFSAAADGVTLLYEAASDTFVVARKDFADLANGYAALGEEHFAVGNALLNASLVPRAFLDNGTLRSTGYGVADGKGLVVFAEQSALPGLIQRFELGRTPSAPPVRLVESSLMGETDFPLTRTLAPLANHQAIMMLSTSGLVAIPWHFDSAVAVPRLTAVVNSANYSTEVASGGLVTIFGENLAPTAEVAKGFPLPHTLNGSLLTVDGAPVPLLYVAPGQINAQLPFHTRGRVRMVLFTENAESLPYEFNVLAGAPAVFWSGSAGPKGGLATILRAKNNDFVTPSNPVHGEDFLVIYLTGLGATNIPVAAGEAAPAGPLAEALMQPSVRLGGVELPVIFAGLTPGFAGLYQINVSVPYWVPKGMEVPLTIAQGSSQTTILVRVVN